MTRMSILLGVSFVSGFYLAHQILLSFISFFLLTCFAYCTATKCIACNGFALYDQCCACLRCGHQFCDGCAKKKLCYEYVWADAAWSSEKNIVKITVNKRLRWSEFGKDWKPRSI